MGWLVGMQLGGLQLECGVFDAHRKMLCYAVAHGLQHLQGMPVLKALFV